jgi:tRNA (guanine-N7-)-methyltransferase
VQSRPYLRRRGRPTRGQARAWDAHQDLVLTDPDGLVDWPAQFDRSARLGIEIGFGTGQALLSWAQQAADWNLLGIDVYQPGIGALLLGIEQAQLSNIRVIQSDARLALGHCFAEASVAEIRIFFPDPWPKTRHRKRRLLQPDFVLEMARCMMPGARVLLATDWEGYADSMLKVLEASVHFSNLHSASRFAPRPVARPLTRFETRGLRLGHDVWDLAFARTGVVTGETVG